MLSLIWGLAQTDADTHTHTGTETQKDTKKRKHKDSVFWKGKIYFANLSPIRRNIDRQRRARVIWTITFCTKIPDL